MCRLYDSGHDGSIAPTRLRLVYKYKGWGLKRYQPRGNCHQLVDTKEARTTSSTFWCLFTLQPVLMGRSAIVKSAGLLREIKNKQSFSNLTSQVQPAEARSADTALWIPHPRTGIYYPKGFEWVMEDVPSNAASFRQSYWLRSGEAELASTSTSNEDVALDHPFL